MRPAIVGYVTGNLQAQRNQSRDNTGADPGGSPSCKNNEIVGIAPNETIGIGRFMVGDDQPGNHQDKGRQIEQH